MILLFILLAVGLAIGVPIGVAIRLFDQTRRLRTDVEDLRLRLARLEAESREPAPESWKPIAESRKPAAESWKPATESRQPVAESREPEAESWKPEAESWKPEAESAHESLESRIGGRWALNVGIAAIVIGIAYFEKLAIDKGWIGELARVIQGGVFGAALIVAGSQFAKRGMPLYGQMLAGGGVAILYVSTYAAFMFYRLIERPTAFAAMVGITILGAVLADRHKSQGLAVFAIGGGFMTPFLVGGTGDAQTALFTYVAIMAGGTVYLARRHAWPLLNLVSYLCTMGIVAAWADRFYTPEKYLRTELWITLFCAMFVAIGLSSRRLRGQFGDFVAYLLWTAPIAYYLASLNILGPHPIAMAVWFIAVALLGGVVSVLAGATWATVIWIAAALPFLGWTQRRANAALVTEGLVTAGALYAIALAAQLRRAAEREPLERVETAWLHLAPLMSFAGAYLMLENTHLAATGPAAAAVAAWYGGLARLFWTRDRDRAVHFAALGFTLLAVAIALQFDGPAVTIGWAAEGAAIVALGLLERRGWLRAGGTILFTIAFVGTIDLLLSVAPANHVVLFNPRAAVALLVIALLYAIAWLHRRDPEAPARDVAITASLIAAQIVSVVLLTSEIHAFFAMRDSTFTRELMVSVTWAVYATALIVVGLQRRYAPIRYFAIALFGITIVKVFFSDLSELEQIYRVISVIGLGIMLLVTAFLYQRMKGTALDQRP